MEQIFGRAIKSFRFGKKAGQVYGADLGNCFDVDKPPFAKIVESKEALQRESFCSASL